MQGSEDLLLLVLRFLVMVALECTAKIYSKHYGPDIMHRAVRFFTLLNFFLARAPVRCNWGSIKASISLGLLSNIRA